MGISKDSKVKSMCSMLSTCGEDLYTLSNELKKKYADEEVDVDYLIEDIKKVISKSMQEILKIEKEISR